jgi:hypothetical protein
MHVTPFSAATILVFAIAFPLHAQGIEVFGGYSVNADSVQNRPANVLQRQIDRDLRKSFGVTCDLGEAEAIEGVHAPFCRTSGCAGIRASQEVLHAARKRPGTTAATA